MRYNPTPKRNLNVILAFLVFVVAAPPLALAEPPLLYLGLYDPQSQTSELSLYNAVAEALLPVKTDFPQYQCLKFSPGGTLYGLAGSKLYSIDPVTGQATLAMNLTDGHFPVEPTSFTFAPDGTFVCYEYRLYPTPAHVLWYYDPYYQCLMELGAVGGLTGLYGIEFVDWTLYGSYENALYTIDLYTGQATLVGTGTSAWGLNLGQDGILRGTHPIGGIVAINRSTGAATLVKDIRSTYNKEPWSAAATVLSVTSISPDSIPNRGFVWAVIRGSGFQPGATAKFTRPGQPDFLPSSCGAASSTEIDCRLDFSGQAVGYWNIVVTNPDGRSYTLPYAFAITLAAPANVGGYLNALNLPVYTVTWDAVPQAAEYCVECSTTSNFSVILAGSGWITATSYEFTGLTDGQEYFYRVRARTLDRPGNWSQTSQADFETGWGEAVDTAASPGQVVLANDGNGAYLSAGTLLSPPIVRYPGGAWGILNFTRNTPAGTALTVDVYNAADGQALLSDAVAGTNLSALTANAIFLQANLSTTDPAATPVLDDWSVAYTERFTSPWSGTFAPGPLTLYYNLTLHVTIPGFTGNITTVPVTLSYHDPDWYYYEDPHTIHLDAQGNYVLEGYPSNTYEITVKVSAHLPLVQTVYINSDRTLEFTLIHAIDGDANCDGAVTIEDYSIMATNYGNVGVWEYGDFNGDGWITIEDYSALVTNYGNTGP
jgi:hypothetical protein